MINEEKVKLMTKIQMFEDSEKEALHASHFYQGDYLILHIIQSFLAYTVMFAVVLGIIILYNLEIILTNYSLEMLLSTGKELIFSYAALLIPTMILSCVIYWFRYRRYRRKVRGFVSRLRQLEGFYQKADHKGQS